MGAAEAKLLLTVGSSVKPFPCESESEAEFTTTLTATLLPEFKVIAPKLTVEGAPALFVSNARDVTACEDALTDSMTSAEICPMATVCAWLVFIPENPRIRTIANIWESMVFMITFLKLIT